jgi:hypothetical protein
VCPFSDSLIDAAREVGQRGHAVFGQGGGKNSGITRQGDVETARAVIGVGVNAVGADGGRGQRGSAIGGVIDHPVHRVGAVAGPRVRGQGNGPVGVLLSLKLPVRRRFGICEIHAVPLFGRPGLAPHFPMFR